MAGHVGNPIAQVGAALTKDDLNRIIEEIALYEVELAPDPTQPDLGTPYLQKVISKCRAYQNRVQYYIQIVKLHEKRVRLELRQRELDLEFKMREKLADDPVVRKQPSVKDREAVAATMLKEEFDAVTALKVDLIDIEETVKLIKSKYDQLKQTSNDIRMQRALIKDDKEIQLSGGEGYSRPVARQDRTVPNGMPAPVQPRIEPTDLLDPAKRPDDFPEPIDAEHAAMMAGFLNSHPKVPSTWTCEECGEEVRLNPTFPAMCPKGHMATCAECGDQQLFSPGGLYCKNGHGGAETKMVVPESARSEAAEEPRVQQAKSVSYSDLLE